MNTPTVIVCTELTFGQFYLRDVGFRCWLNFQSDRKSDIEDCIHNLARNGCKAIFISGEDAAGHHDEIDSILDDIQIRDMPTIWQNHPLKEMAWEFLNLELNNDEEMKFFIIVPFGRNSHQELEGASEIISAMSQSMK